MEIETKQPIEEYPIELDFGDKLGAGEKIDSFTVKAYLSKDECTEQIIKSSSFKNDVVIVHLKNGYENNYKVSVVVTTDDDNVYERDVLLLVRNI